MTVLGAILLPAWASIVGWGSARWLASAAPTAPVRRRVSADSGWPASQPPVALPPATPAAGTGVGSVFGVHGPAGGPEVPPPPAPPTIDGYPSVVPVALDRSGGHVPVGRGGIPLTHVEDALPRTAAGDAAAGAFRSTMHAAPAENPAPAFQPLLGSAELTYESSAEVSAVQGAPTLGAPRAARTSVSAQHKRPEIPEDESFAETIDETIVAVRRRAVWALVPNPGAPVPLTAEIVIIGRRPHREPEDGDAQLIVIPDETRTVSKTHARMELTADGWTIVDLDSTNGVILIGDDGAETDAVPGRPERLTARFLLGDAEFGLRREGE
ncbi:MAG TPA: hypothetical protein DCR63_06730 [Microbacterium sp.]|nr:hypothetical protein [Microbacterium sp.]